MAAPRSPPKRPRLLAACLALVKLCVAAKLNNSAWDLTVGEPFVVTWTGADAPVWIYLDENLVQGSTPPHFDAQQVLDFNDSSTAFTWTPPDNDGGRTWAFELSALGASTADYSPNFVIASAAGGSVVSLEITSARQGIQIANYRISEWHRLVFRRGCDGRREWKWDIAITVAVPDCRLVGQVHN
ncbi:hypothetical protein B0T26DRAFT_81249 [Lasiosphaeria miniovina]|uniref:Uncharacterized protein n=1 Tax=Lasiosphaeria miniovina TaxID=1954250 RepID=A0AA40BIB9_9PEZI|nr:uncharacterized protein B0T26DRAFT_81249 [Lasiosphaeria miniovina]KAK0734760.1 hypothetical protein B0T26DRAFT_81249 [Lasiosphaeria miniovina]